MSFDHKPILACLENRQKGAENVLSGIVAIAERNGGMSASQKGFASICRRMLRDDHALHRRLQILIDARTRA